MCVCVLVCVARFDITSFHLHWKMNWVGWERLELERRGSA